MLYAIFCITLKHMLMCMRSVILFLFLLVCNKSLNYVFIVYNLKFTLIAVLKMLFFHIIRINSFSNNEVVF